MFEVFQVLHGFLIKIYKEGSNISSESQENQENSDDFGVDDPADSIVSPSLVSVYLVEPRQASMAVLKFSGTLGMRNRFDRQSATIMAFSHFVLQNLACKYMLADIQGEFTARQCVSCTDTYTGSMDRRVLSQNESVLTLFDPMMRTPCG